MEPNLVFRKPTFAPSSAEPVGKEPSASSRRLSGKRVSDAMPPSDCCTAASLENARAAFTAASEGEPRALRTASRHTAGGVFRPAPAMVFNAATRVSGRKTELVTASARSCCPASDLVRMPIWEMTAVFEEPSCCRNHPASSPLHSGRRLMIHWAASRNVASVALRKGTASPGLSVSDPS